MDYYFIHQYLGKALRLFDHSSEKVLSKDSSFPHHVLYQMEVSPYCKKVVKYLVKNNLGLELKDILESKAAYEELMLGGKKDQVPCLHIRTSASSTSEDRWLYESKEIIRYLETTRVSPAPRT